MCGGESKRMGTDKGLLVQDGKTWAEIAFSNLSALEIPVALSVNKTQVQLYSEIFSEDPLVMDNESLPVKGPLLGLLSTHQQFPGEDLLVLACDMINMQKNILQNLLKTFREQPFDAYVYTVVEKVQPLCGIYTSKGLKNILDLCLKNQLKKYSMMYALECLVTKYIAADKFAGCFANYNSVEDISIDKSIS